jgi:hypothetical protein
MSDTYSCPECGVDRDAPLTFSSDGELGFSRESPALIMPGSLAGQ